ncbi:TPA: hypothetical protein N0F65_008675 [Lagenidium giganteum]|uniref:SH3 domain-containing protein n=1 Tax=Lagenidium giganteum TaxID=4803 RepID=A0AAV2Z831_9STRA|nr:TPA: hypothetical protein N0F65_008675 [Lagenidium giganteum]
MGSRHNGLEMEQLTDLVSGEIDRQFQARNDMMDTMKEQMSKVLKEFEDVSWNINAKRSWAKSMARSKDIQPTNPAAEIVHPLTLATNIHDPANSPPRLPKLVGVKGNKAGSETRSPDGKLVFDKKLPRVANIDKRNEVIQGLLATQQKQTLHERALVRYPQCRSNVFVPSAYEDLVNFPDPGAATNPPSTSLELEFVYGYHNSVPATLSQAASATASCSNASNAFYLATGEILWFAGAVVILYSPESNSQRYFREHSQDVTCIGLHPNQHLVASGQIGKETSVLVWDADDDQLGKRMISLKGHTVAVRSISFSHDGRLIASLGGDMYNTICIHDWKEQSLLTTARGHSFRVHTVAFNPFQAYGRPDSKRSKKPGQALHDDDACYTLVSCGVRHIRFWTLTKTEYTPPATEESESSAFYGSTFGGPPRMRPPTPHEKIWKLEGNIPSFNGRFEVQDFTSVTFVDDSPPLYIFDETGKELVPTKENDRTLGRIIAGTAKGDLCVFWQPRKSPNAEVMTDKQKHKEPAKWWEIPDEYTDEEINELVLEKVEFEPTAKLVELVPRDQETGDRFKISKQAQAEIEGISKRLSMKPNQASLHSRLSELKYAGPTGHQGMTYQVAYCKSTQLIASSGGDGRIVLWKCQMTSPVRVPGVTTLGVFTTFKGKGSDGVHSLAPVDEETMVFTLPVALPGEVGEVDEETNAAPTQTPRPTSLVWSADGKRLLVGTSTNCIWELRIASGEWTCLFEARSGGMVECASHPSKEEIATVSLDGRLSIWDIRRRVCKRRLVLVPAIVPAGSKPTCVEFHPFGDELAVGMQSGEFVVINYVDFRLLRKIAILASPTNLLDAHGHPLSTAITALKYCPKAQFLAVGSKDTSIYIYDVANRYKKLHVCEGHASAISQLTWSVDSDVLYSNATDSEILHWSIPSAPKSNVKQITDALAVRDVQWSRWTCVLGWAVVGVWSDDVTSLADIPAMCTNATSDALGSEERSDQANGPEEVLVVANRTSLRLFKWPALRGAKAKTYRAHSTNITSVCFSMNNRYIFTTGGDDGTLLQWRCVFGRGDGIPSPMRPRVERNKSLDTDEDQSGAPSPVPPPVGKKALSGHRSPRQVARTYREVPNDTSPSHAERDDDADAPDGNAQETARSDEGDRDAEAIAAAAAVGDFVGQYRVVHDFTAENPDELNLRAGELIRVLAKTSSEWWTGESCDGTRGIFPAGYVELATTSETASSPNAAASDVIDATPRGDVDDVIRSCAAIDSNVEEAATTHLCSLSVALSSLTMVQYRSTRGGMRGLSFEQAVLTGLASDRGLLVPEEGQFPTLPPDALLRWSALSYHELAVEVMSLFIDASEVSRAELKALVEKSYNQTTFRHDETAPVKQVTDHLLVLELFHGPTFAFKDIALQFLGNLFEFFLKRKNAAPERKNNPHKVTVVGATSGDTGSSAIYGLRGKENIEVFILFPHGRVSKIQERQMTTVLDDNIHNVAVKGTFDDCQAIVKDLFADAEFKAKYNLGAVNSINWARILAQIVYYVYAYFRAKEMGIEEVAFSVPTGNFGDILAGFYAKRLGLPIGKLIVATNENDILHRFFSTGEYHRYQIQHTTSPSMDICVSSNFERYLFALSGEDSSVLRRWMSDFESTGKLTLSGSVLAQAQDEMASYCIKEDEVCSVISRFQKIHQYLFDPHSAIGAAAAEHFGEAHLAEKPKAAVVVVGTAHYGKFLPVVSKALGVSESEVKQHELLKALEVLPTRLTVRENSKASVVQLIRETMSKCKSQCMWAKLDQLRPEAKLVTASLVVAATAVAFFVVKRTLLAK